MSYYNQHAQEFFDSTVHVEMDILPLVQKGGNILDAGCGSGRDSKAFKELSFQVHAIDASAVLAKLAEELIEQPVQIATFQILNLRNALTRYGRVLHCFMCRLMNFLIRFLTYQNI
ncbi:class I SAM-dependent methyltransferase [Vibrio parahaemolyticus]|uniref:class I SAM-dependent methyltransferase n=1 Tax=Vibrio parahaemolyticus TaxID=670 RepID=UPI001120C2BC|nr:class I SAM-dependent methyltransferase [Vibrio parahaemolyticus]TOD90084.1 hypothetical protein CGJ53_23710 [Vibrio parahaemolyticus]